MVDRKLAAFPSWPRAATASGCSINHSDWLSIFLEARAAKMFREHHLFARMRLDQTTTSYAVRRPKMIDHTGIGVADVGRSATFYDAALKALGMRRVMQMPEKLGTDGVGYGFDYPVFWIDRYHPNSVKQHTAFAAKSRADVDAFHAAAVRAGGTENGAPGLRRPNYYAAFVLDPDGNN